jgi:hypothetical protein
MEIKLNFSIKTVHASYDASDENLMNKAGVQMYGNDTKKKVHADPIITSIIG